MILPTQCHPVYNHDGSVNCFFCDTTAQARQEVVAVAFPLLESFVFAVALAVAFV